MYKKRYYYIIIIICYSAHDYSVYTVCKKPNAGRRHCLDMFSMMDVYICSMDVMYCLILASSICDTVP